MFGMNDEDLFVFLGAVADDTVLGVEEATLFAKDEVFREIDMQAEGSKIYGLSEDSSVTAAFQKTAKRLGSLEPATP